jgi:hypothetical protein
MDIIGTDGRQHGAAYREQSIGALRAGIGAFPMSHTVADAMQGIGHGTLACLTPSDRRSMYGFAAVMAGTPDYGQNDPATDCVDALTNVLLYAYRIGADVDALIGSAVDHFEAERND